MRRPAAAAFLAITIVTATVLGGLAPALAQAGPGPGVGPTTTIILTPSTRGNPGIPPLGLYVMGTVACSAASPIIGTIILGREMTATEVGRSALGCFLRPVGWVLGPVLFPDPVVTIKTPPRQPPSQRIARQGRGRNISIPPPSELRFVRNEVLVEIEAGVSQRTLDTTARRLQLTRLETQSFTLTARTLQRWRIEGNRSATATLRALARYRVVAAAQPNWLYTLQQTAQAAPPQETSAQSDPGAQYVVSKMHLLEAHRVTTGDDVLVAVIDSRIDTAHPDLAGVVVDQFDTLGGTSMPHAHGTGMAGAIAAHSKLIGVAPKVRLLAVRTFAGEGDSAQGTTFNILKGIDWAAAKNARIVNMSFAGPADAMLRDMLGKAHARGMVLIAAVGCAGPRSPPLYPAGDPHVIGVTATDASDKLLPQANRGPQVAVAAPGVDILAAAPDGQYQVTSGTSVAAAHASGVAALLLARKASLTPDELRRALIGSAQPVDGKPRDIGAGVIDAFKAVDAVDR
jgi:Subtilase family